MNILSSKWDGLNPSLLATIYPVGPDGQPIDGPRVLAPPTDFNMELTGNWQSPFEQSGAETKAPAIMAMLQTGALGSYTQAIGDAANGAREWLSAKLPSLRGLLGTDAAQPVPGAITGFISESRGRTGMTKLNSTQVFTGAAPIKLTMTLHFRAFRDARVEVGAPVDQLARWVLAKSLAQDGAIVSAGRGLASGSLVAALLPSLAPQMVALRFGGYAFAPLVIESMSYPMTGPRSSAGDLLAAPVQVVLSSLTALDQEDWSRARRGEPINLFNSR